MTSSPASSLLATFQLSSGLERYSEISKDMSDFRVHGIYDTWGQARIGWVCATPFNSSSNVSVSFACPLASGGVVLEDNLFDLLHATVPSVLITDSGTAIFYGLDFVTVLTVAASDFTISVNPISEDTDVLWMEPGSYAWERILAKDSAIQAASGVITLPVSDPILVTYSSSLLVSSLDASGTVSFNGGPYMALSKVDLRNGWDEVSSLFGLSRLLREDNFQLAERASSSYGFPGSPDYIGLTASIARELNLVESGTWSPSSPFVPAFSDVTAYSVPLIQRQSLITEAPLSIGNGFYLLSNSPDPETLYVVNSGGVPIMTPESTGNLMYAPEQVTVSYGVTRYEPSTSVSGYLTEIVPSTGAIISMQEVQVWMARGVVASTLGLMTDKLLLPNGDPTPYFMEIGSQIQQALQVSLGEASWNKVTWFNSTDNTPRIGYIPRVLDS
jgi:hypothetical protein